MRRTRGTSLVELLVGAAVGLLVLTAVTGTLAAGGRALVRGGARAEAADTAALAIEAFLFDARRAGHDPSAAGIEPLVQADAERLAVQADLDGDGTVDTASAELVAWRCNAAARRLSRLVGAQSLPLADRVARCRFDYLDRDGTVLAIPPGGLDAAGRASVAAVVLDFALAPRGGGPTVARTIAVSPRSRT
jgi:hypothetical protein